MSPSVYEVERSVLRDVVGGAVLAAVGSGRGAGEGIGSVPGRACAALYALLCAHEIDRRGRCRACRPGNTLGARRRTCRVLVTARFYLHQPEDVLLRYLAAELGEPDITNAGRPDHDATDVLPRLGAAGHDPQHVRRLVITTRPLPGHGGAGEPSPPCPRPRRAPPGDPPPSTGLTLVLTGGTAWPG